MKRKLSLLMVLMMMLTLIPANMAFATSDTKAKYTQTSSDGTVKLELVIESTGTGIATDATVVGATSPATFEVVLGDNAEWASAPTFTVTDQATGLAIPAITQGRTTDQRVEFEVTSKINAGTKIVISGADIKFSGAETGEQKLVIRDVVNSDISNQTITYANVIGSGSVISRTLEDTKTHTRGTATLADFELRETTANAIQNGKFEMRLPKDITWASGTVIKVNGAIVTPEIITGSSPATAYGDRTLTVDLTGYVLNSSIDRIVVEPQVNITKDAKLGDIEVEFIGKTTEIDADSLKVGEYKEYGITMTVDKVESIVAGKADTSKDYVVEVTLDPAGQSFVLNRPMDFTLKGGDVKLKSPTSSSVANIVGIDGYDDEFEVSIKDATKLGNKFKFELYLKAGWNKAGELTLTGKGGGMDEQTIKIADILAPAKVTTKVDDTKTVADVIVGLQGQATPEITITESEAGSLQEGYYVLDLNQARYSGVEFLDTNVKFETTGNISVDDVYTINDGEQVVIYVDGESTKEAASIVIKGLQVTLDRAVPFGQIDLRLGAVVADETDAAVPVTKGDFNVDPETKKFDTTVKTIVEKIPFLNVVTEVQTARQQKTVFTLDSATYTVGSETKTLDAAPYISNNRTMLPIGTVAQLAGATLNYSPSTRTAVFTKDNLVVSMNLDTNILLVNGSPVPMDAKPEIVNSRAFVPVVYVAQAFGIQNGTDIVYDAASRTVTLFPNAQ